jgi:hypothetical protein
MLDQLARLKREVFGSPAAEKELSALWRHVFGQPPPVVGAPNLLSRILVQNLPPAPPYRLGAPAADEEGESGPPDR